MTDAYSVGQILGNRIAQTPPLGDTSQRVATTQFVANATRLRLTANTTVFVDPTNGNDANNGFSSGTGAFKTVAAAYAAIQNNLDFNGKNVTLQLASATYSGLNFNGGWVGAGKLILDGGGGTITASVSGTDAIFIAIQNVNTSLDTFTIQNVTITCSSGSPAGGDALHVESGIVNIGTGITFGAVTNGAHMFADGPQARILLSANYTISGGASVAHYFADFGGFIETGSTLTITLTGTPAFGFFADILSQSNLQLPNATFSGSASAGTTRWLVAANATINTGTGSLLTANSGSTTYFPGGTNGTSVTGGLYV